jgi:peptidoglycan/LPS O-acetylase OafA/YrhL
VPASSPGLSSSGGGEDSESLDQWRGLALVLVLISHGLYFTGKVSGIGRVGVNLFFFISGILVFRSLSRSSASDFKGRAISFWTRRFRRLYPALVGYLLLALPITYVFQNRPDVPQHCTFSDYVARLPNGFLYLINYTPPPCHTALNHLWSLSTEVQFYFLAPIVFALGGVAAARRRWVWGTMLAVLMGLGMLQPRFGDGVKYYFEFSVWPMMLGFVAEWMRPRFEGFCRVVAKPALVATVFALLLSIGLMMLGTRAKIVVVAIGAFMIFPCYCAYVAGIGLGGRTGRLMTWLGQRTYSIYLWQQPLTLCGYIPPVLHPVGAILSCLVGAISFRWLEQPFLRRKTGPRKATATLPTEACAPAAPSPSA